MLEVDLLQSILTHRTATMCRHIYLCPRLVYMSQFLLLISTLADTCTHRRRNRIHRSPIVPVQNFQQAKATSLNLSEDHVGWDSLYFQPQQSLQVPDDSGKLGSQNHGDLLTADSKRSQRVSVSPTRIASAAPRIVGFPSSIKAGDVSPPYDKHLPHSPTPVNMYTKVVHIYGCGHESSEKVPRAILRTAPYIGYNTKTVKHDENCDECDY
jgi:hypothetical protein